MNPMFNKIPGLNQSFAGGGIGGTLPGGGFPGGQTAVNSADAQYFHDLMAAQNKEIVQLKLAAAKNQACKPSKWVQELTGRNSLLCTLKNCLK
ncbi:hypothetical protein CS022_17140 [Veronia nyctiphanis]|uniref:Uncharacterized protein n=1 Tax=Veronia nyctiphanis TaxID=1278244 RepID=A0A4Q0YMZ5_9GAMM|nr:hypothetical protein [Veronia nyctiphanis]RXJ72270.1 hypothetical protein CS022_17140 [Veronia nyctiphanis]